MEDSSDKGHCVSFQHDPLFVCSYIGCGACYTSSVTVADVEDGTCVENKMRTENCCIRVEYATT